MRCLTLADAMLADGHRCTFFCRHLTNQLENRISERHLVRRLPEGSSPHGSRLRHSAWLGVGALEDANSMIQMAEAAFYDLVIVDHYGLDLEWEAAIRQISRKIMVIDDLADRNHDCDLILDQNFRAEYNSRYLNLLPFQAKKMMGPRYALLQKDYARLHKTAIPRNKMGKVLIYFGAGDRDNSVTYIAASALLNMDCVPDIEIEIVIPTDVNELSADLYALAERNRRITIHHDLRSLAEVVANIDFAITAIGGATWERLCLGVPSISATFAFNQIAVATELHNAGLIYHIGPAHSITPEKIEFGINDLARDRGIESMSRRCLAVCDGMGTARVINEIKKELRG